MLVAEAEQVAAGGDVREEGALHEVVALLVDEGAEGDEVQGAVGAEEDPACLAEQGADGRHQQAIQRAGAGLGVVAEVGIAERMGEGRDRRFEGGGLAQVGEGGVAGGPEDVGHVARDAPARGGELQRGIAGDLDQRGAGRDLRLHFGQGHEVLVGAEGGAPPADVGFQRLPLLLERGLLLENTSLERLSPGRGRRGRSSVCRRR